LLFIRIQVLALDCLTFGCVSLRCAAFDSTAARLPSADGIERLGNRDGVLLIPYERWNVEQHFPSEQYTAARFAALIRNIANFDSVIFATSVPEAKLMDPQHRILLELCYQVGRFTVGSCLWFFSLISEPDRLCGAAVSFLLDVD
jgi:hypothetical protein